MKVRALKYYSVFSIVLIALLFLLSLGQIEKLKFDYSFDSFFPTGDPELAYYQEFVDAFGQQNDFLFLAFEDTDLSSISEIKTLRIIEDSLEQWKEIQFVSSHFDEQIYQVTPFGINIVQKYPPTRALDTSKLDKNDDIGKYFSKKGDAVLMIINHIAFDDKPSGDAFYERLDSWLSIHSPFPTVVSGKIQMQKDFTDLLEEELGMLLGLGFAICLIILLVLFRSLKSVLLSILVMILTIILTLGIMGFLGKPIDVMMVMLPAILLIISLSDTIHLINKYDYLLEDETPYRAILKATKAIGKANFITSITTAIGFLGLYFLRIQPIKDFGIFAALGILIAFLVTISVVPSLLFFFPSSKRSQYKLQKGINKLTKRLTNYTQSTTAVTLIFSSILLVGFPFLELNTGLIVGLQRDEPMLEKVAYFDKNFNGYRPIEVGVKLEKAESTDSIVSTKINLIEKALGELMQTRGIQSTNSIIKKINSGLYGGAQSQYDLPDQKDIPRVKRIYKSKRLAEARKKVEVDAPHLLRIVGVSPDLGSAFFIEKSDSLKQFLNEINDEQFEAKLTGSSYLIDKTDRYVIGSLTKGLAFACITVALITLLFYRSWRMSLLILIVNVIPLLLLFGSMGLLGIDLNISTAIIFTVALGISVDDSIHLISRYVMERRNNKSKTEALRLAKTFTGKSILFTSLAIGLGFSVLLFSGFSAVYYLGLFICLSALLALWFDLKVLPKLIEKWKYL